MCSRSLTLHANLFLNLPDLFLQCLVAAKSDRFQIMQRQNAAADVVVLGNTHDKKE
jgi:hypothetical protein